MKDNATGELIDTEIIRNPIDVNTIPYFVDMKAMRDFAKEKGVSISSLTESEKEKFFESKPRKQESF